MWKRTQYLQMAAAMREAMPRGDVQSTALTILLITALKACGTQGDPKSKNAFQGAPGKDITRGQAVW